MSISTGNRDLPAEETLGRCRVVLDDVPYVAGLPAGVRDRVTGAFDLESCELVSRSVDQFRETSQEPRTVCRSDLRPSGERGLPPGLIAASASTPVTSGHRLTTCSVAGLITENVEVTAFRSPGTVPSR